MRLLMVGAGGIGGYFGARFAAGGHDVTFLARGAHLAGLHPRGLTIESTVAPAQLAVQATDRIKGAGQPELIAGVDAPVMRTLYAALKPYLNGAQNHGAH